MRHLSISFFLISILSFPSCKTKPKHFIEGQWTMTTDEQVMIFKSDSVMHWIFHGPFLDDTFKVRYGLDLNKSPQHINLFDFNRGILKDKILTGILEHQGIDTIRMDFQLVDTWAEADSARPKAFVSDQVRFFVRK